jgi:hypothetical protein
VATERPTPPPVSNASMLLEAARSLVLFVLLLAATILLLFAGAWILAVVVAVVTVAAVFAGALTRPALFVTAGRAEPVATAMALPLARHRQAWLRLDDGSGESLFAEIRSPRLARMLSPGPVPVTVIGPFEPGCWVVVQAQKLTVWPVRRLEADTPPGAKPVVPKTEQPRRSPHSFWR